MDATPTRAARDRLAPLRNEKHCAVLYRAMAEAERDPAKRELFHALALNAEKQLAALARDLGVAGTVAVNLRCRIVALIVRLCGARFARPLLEAMKVRGLAVYRGRRAHMPPKPTTAAEVRERHRADTSGALRAAVFGINDGLVSNTCLILGVAGAAADNRIVLLTGVAGWLAGAFSMAAGEYVSMSSQRELYEYQIGLERDELRKYPEHQAAELAIIFAARGVPKDEARSFADKLVANPEDALDAIAREELGLNPEELGSPWRAAGSSFASFTVGALVPVAPFVIGDAGDVLAVAAGLAGLALFAVGAALSLFSGRHAILGGARMLLIGSLAAGASFAIGKLLGVGIAG